VVVHLETLLADEPNQHRARLSLALVQADLGRFERSEALFREAIVGFTAESDARGAVYSGQHLGYVLIGQGRFDAAEQVLEQAEGTARSSDDSELMAAVFVEQALAAYRRSDFGRAWTRYREASELVDASSAAGAYLLSRTLEGLGDVGQATGRYAEAVDFYRRRAELMHERGGMFDEADDRLRMGLMADRLWREGAVAASRERVLQLLEAALELSIEVGNGWAEAGARLALGRHLRGDEALRHYEKGLALAQELNMSSMESRAYRLLARHRVESSPGQPDAALDLVDRALEMARLRGDFSETALGLVDRAEIRWTSASDSEKAADWLSALDAIERVRDLQPVDTVRARFLSDWSFAYYRFAGLLLEPFHETPPAARFEVAFDVSERLRARVLLDRMDSARATDVWKTGDELGVRHSAGLESIARTQKRLIDPELPADARAEALRRLEELEAEEMALREEIARADPAFATLNGVSFPSLTEVRESLGEDIALLSFQLPGMRDPHGGLAPAWLQVITAGGARVYPLPEVEVVEAAAKFWLGLLDRRDGSDALGASRVYEITLKAAMEALPPAVERLVILPDGVLHRMPWGALRADPDAPPLAARYEIHVAPSVTTWMRLRQRRQLPIDAPALVLADPMPPLVSGASDEAQAADRAWALSSGVALGALPYAREEGRSIKRRVGGSSRLLTGEQASERFLKRADLAAYSILHFAAHGVVDDLNPERSAVLLAPGAEEEDGLLQIRDLAGLDLSSKVIVLSACRSASGTLMRGEGVLGLARGFFQVGSSTVVGSLWRLRDREAAELFEAFYRHLREGESVGAALTAAQRDRMRAGAPPAAWAGVVVMGDGAIVPLSRTRGGMFLVWAGSFAALALAAGYLVWSRRKRRKPRPRPASTG
jgi:CHAT domain-containing protein/tetratricopeptide (TPR) repeat protein